MNEDVITVVGKLGGDPTLKSVHGDRVAEFRLASTARRKEGDEYVNGHTNWYSVEAWGDFAQHVAASLRKGDLIVVLGKLRIEQWESGEKRGTSVKIRAEHLGHSLRTGAVAKDRRPAPDAATSLREQEPVHGPESPRQVEPVLQAVGQDAWTAPLAEPDQPF